MSDKLNEGFGKIGKSKSKRKVAPTQKVVRSERKKQGRPTFKEEGTEYVKLGCYVPKETKKKMGYFLIDNNQIKTQAELINIALLEYMERHSS